MKILSKNTSDAETKDTCNNDKYHTPEQALKILFGYDSFRAGQKSVDVYKRQCVVRLKNMQGLKS